MGAIGKLCNKINNTLFPSPPAIYAIVFIRVIATCLITNTHYNNVYPSEKFAVGGLLGDVLFFAVSGFCYSKGIKVCFCDWYSKRWKRIYPSVLIMVLLFSLIGFWTVTEKKFFYICSYFILPTNFLFFGAIMILYIPMFFCVNQKNGLLIWAIIWCVLYSIFYIFVFDKTTYFMNDVSELAILFLYFGAILVGVAVGRFRNQLSSLLLASNLIAGPILVALYYWLTITVRSNSDYYLYQIIVPISLLLLCLSIMIFFVGIEKYLKRVPLIIVRFFSFIANLTLEIYVVQLVIIHYLSHIVFPLNWFLITFSIVAAAVVLKLLVAGLISCPTFLKEHLVAK